MLVLNVFVWFAALMALGTVPLWPYSREWGYGPSGGLSLLAVIVVVLLIAARS